MEQQNKIELPVKTKIAAFIIFAISWFVLAFFIDLSTAIIPFALAGFLVYKKKKGLYWIGVEVFFILVGLIFAWGYLDLSWIKIDYAEIILGILLWAFLLFIAISFDYRKKYAWWAAIFTILPLALFYILGALFMVSAASLPKWAIFSLFCFFLFIAAPFILLLIDRNNYFAAVEKGKGKKN
jgi:hypothetical protein